MHSSTSSIWFLRINPSLYTKGYFVNVMFCTIHALSVSFTTDYLMNIFVTKKCEMIIRGVLSCIDMYLLKLLHRTLPYTS